MKTASDTIMENIAVYDALKRGGFSDAIIDRIERAVNSHDELLWAVKIALEYTERQNRPRNLKEQIAFREHQQEVFREAIAKAEGK